MGSEMCIRDRKSLDRHNTDNAESYRGNSKCAAGKESEALQTALGFVGAPFMYKHLMGDAQLVMCGNAALSVAMPSFLVPFVPM